MTETEQDLARELARHPAWKWMNGIRLLYVGPPRLGFDARRVDNGDQKEPREGWIPDLSDPATQGCLIAMLGTFDLLTWHAMSGVFEISRDESLRPSYIGHKAETFGEALARAWLVVNGGDRCGS